MKNQIEVAKEEQKSILSMADIAMKIAVVDEETANQANDFLVKCRLSKKKIHEICDPVCDAANKAHKATTKQRADLLDPIEKAEKIIEPKVIAYQRKIIEEQRKEQERLFKEAQKIAEEKALQTAIEAEKLGAKEIVEEILAAPVQYVAPIVAAQPKMEGLSEREFWTFEVINSDWIPKEYLIVDEKKISGVVKALKDKAQIPGVRVYCEKRLAVRTA